MINWDHLPMVEPLSLEAAKETYTAICPTVDSSLEELLAQLDHVPLAIVLMAHIGQKGDGPKQLLERWNEEYTSFLSCHVQHPSRLNSVEVSIKVSLHSPTMAAIPEAQQLLSLISLLPAGVLRGQLPAIASIMSRPNQASDVLRGTALAYYNKEGTLNVLSPIRRYMLVYHPPSEELVKHLEQYYCKLAKLGCSQPGDQDYRAASQNLQKEEGNMGTILLHALTYHPDCHVVQAGIDFSQFLYWTRPGTTIISLAAKVAGDLRESELEAVCLQMLGDILRMQDKYDEASSTLADAKVQFESIGNQLGAAQCLRSLGNILRMQTKYDEASSALTDAKVQFESIGNQLGAAQCLRSLGNILSMQDKYDEASSALTDAKVQFETIGSQLGAAQCLQSLGDILRMQDKYDEASSTLADAKVQFETIGDQLGAAQCLQSLGNILRMQDKYEEASSALTDAKVQFESIGNQLGAAQCLRSLGDILRMQAKYDEASSVLTDAKVQFETIGDQLGAAQCLQSLGDILSMQYKYDEGQMSKSSLRPLGINWVLPNVSTA